MKGVVWPLVLTTAIQALAAMAIFSPPVFAPVAHDEIGYPASWVGFVTSLVFTAATAGALFSGGVIARIGALRMSQLSLLLCAAGLALFATAIPGLILLGALVIGAGYGPVTPSSSAILAERTPERIRALIFSLKQTGVPIGGALAGGILPTLIFALGWRSTALAVAVICIAVASAIQPYRASVDLHVSAGRPVQPAGLLEPLRFVLSHPRLREMALASTSYSGMQSCLSTYLVVYLVQRIGFSVPLAGATLATAMSAGIVARIVFGVVADNWVRPRVLLGMIGLTMTAGAALTAAFNTSWPVPLILLVAAAYGASAIGWNGVYLSEVARIAPAGRAGSATGASLAMTYAGVMVMPLLFLLIVSLTGSFAAAFLAAALVTLWRSAFFFRAAERRE
jgi:MFS family permease